MNGEPILTISILVHEDFTHIAPALKNIQDHTRTPHRVYVVINKGLPDQIQVLQQTFPHLNFILNETPQGFAANHNVVMRLAKTPYVALLNDDISIHDDVLDVLVNYLEQQPRVGVVAPQLQYADGSPQVTAYSDPSLLRMIYKISGLGRFTHQQSAFRNGLLSLGAGRWLKTASLTFPTEACQVEVLKAAAIVVRKATIDEVGLIDETTKAYGEEIDWNLRMRHQGWHVVLLPERRITHFGLGQAHMQLKGWQITEDRKAILNYFMKHKPTWQTNLIRVAMVLLHTLQLMISVFISPKDVASHRETIKLAFFWKRPTL